MGLSFTIAAGPRQPFIVMSESRRTHDHNLLSQIRDPPNLEARSPYLYPSRTGWPSYNPRHCVPFPSHFATRRATVEMIRTRLHILEGQSESEFESYVTTDGQPASLSWNKAPIWGLRPDFYYLCDSIPVFSYILSARTTHRKHSPSIVSWRRPHRKHVSRVRL
jgi:hypothetical protein